MATHNCSTVLFPGVTNNLKRRIWEHQQGLGSKSASRDRVTSLVSFEQSEGIHLAMAREKQIKGGSRQKTLDLIKAFNPEWCDLCADL